MRCQKMTLEMTLRGEGVLPAVTCSHPGGLLDLGYVLEKESTSHVLKVSQHSADGKILFVSVVTESCYRPILKPLFEGIGSVVVH